MAKKNAEKVSKSQSTLTVSHTHNVSSDGDLNDQIVKVLSVGTINSSEQLMREAAAMFVFFFLLHVDLLSK